MIARFFIDRPIFAASLSIVITLLGALAMIGLPLTQYPPIVPPTIRVQATYPGASAETVAEAVAAPIEQQVNGVEDMLYMSSQCANDGSYLLQVTFKPGVNLNFAQVLVQNRVSLALPLLPTIVKSIGVSTRKRNPDILLIVSLNSPDARYDQLYLTNYANINMKDELARVEGVSDVFLFGGQDYSMRIWVDPDKLSARNLGATDVANIIRAENSPIAAGNIGGPPLTFGQAFQLPLTALGRLTYPEQFNQIVLKTNDKGGMLKVKDVGHSELGARSGDIVGYLDGKPAVNVAVFQRPDANALDTADLVRAKVEELKKAFPEGVDYDIVYDTTPFIRESVNEVYKTLGDAVILVALVVLIFLQNWRSALIPLVAVPVAIIGTFAAMAAIGFSINNLTLFGLVLAIGIVVDDAIVVVEAVEHHIEQGLSPRAATYKAMDEVSGPVIAVGCVLSAVFVPCAFISGITGQFFRQFALTIAVSTLISMFNSLTLSPALCAILLRPRGAHQGLISQILNFLLGWFFRLFNWTFKKTSSAYTRVVGLALRGSVIVLAIYGGLLVLTCWGFTQIPTGYIPSQDRGYIFLSIQMPDATSLERTIEAVRHIEDLTKAEPGVAHTIAVAGQSFVISAYGSNFGQMFIILDEFHDRRDPSLYSDLIAARLKKKASDMYPDAIIAAFGPAPINGLGTSGGIKYMLEDRSDQGMAYLDQQNRNFLKKANKYHDDNVRPVVDESGHPVLNQAGEPVGNVISGAFTSFRADTPQLLVDVDRNKCAMLGVDVLEVYNTMEVYLGSLYINDFNQFEHPWQVNLQALGKNRTKPEDIHRLKVRSKQGKMVPLGSLVDVRLIHGPLLVTRYNMYPAVTISANLRPGVSSGQAIAAMEKLSEDELPAGMSYEWTEITYLQLIAGNTAMLIFGLSVIGVFLVLAALYESWTLPLAVILVVPMCLLGSLTGVWLSKADINIFTQVGFVVLVGLASKNAILIVEFAKLKRDAGMSRRQATLEACQLRLRPILMTSFAFIFGVIPLMISVGAGYEMRRLLGTAVFSGMLGVTLFGIFLTPVFFYVIDWLGEKAIFGSPVTRRILLATAVLLGLVGFLTAEALVVLAWWYELLSLAGVVGLTFGLVTVVLLVLIVQLRRSNHPLSHQLPLFTLWPHRARWALDLLAGTNGHRNGDSHIAAVPKRAALTGLHKPVPLTGRMPAVDMEQTPPAKPQAAHEDGKRN